MVKYGKSLLLRLSPASYFWLRDRWQYRSLQRSGRWQGMLDANRAIESDLQALEFSKSYIRSYQIDSEILGLIEALRELAPVNYLEIGTADGGTHFLIRRRCPSIRKSVAIDTDIRNRLLIDQLTDTTDPRYIVGRSDSVQTMKALYRAFSEPGSLDALFIDGDHSYEGVKSDFDRYRHLVRSGGYIVLHDIVQDWGQRYGRSTNKYTGGVPRFFSEQQEHFDCLTFVDNPEQDGFGIGVLIQP